MLLITYISRHGLQYSPSMSNPCKSSDKGTEMTAVQNVRSIPHCSFQVLCLASAGHAEQQTEGRENDLHVRGSTGQRERVELKRCLRSAQRRRGVAIGLPRQQCVKVSAQALTLVRALRCSFPVQRRASITQRQHICFQVG